ncbi:glycosyltransferase [Thermodesulfobacteriota bacterium]
MVPILFFLPDLNGGGAQRTVINIVNHIDRKAFQPILVIGTTEGPLREALSQRVKIVDLHCNRVRGAIIPLSHQIKRWYPKILFSGYPDANVAMMLAKKLSGWKGQSVFRESNNRTASKVDWGIMMRHLVKWSYRAAPRVVALSNGVREDLIKRYGILAEKVRTIYNPVDIEAIKRMASQKIGVDKQEDTNFKGKLKIISAGRLVKQKGFDILIKSIAKIKDQPIHLTILGEGEEKDNLINLRDKYGLKDTISLPGFQKNPYPWMRLSDVFVLSSRWEGFGHVIVEAMACGLPVIATKCPSGPDEIINDGMDGLLCEPESAEDLAEKIDFLVNNQKERERLSRAGLGTAERFDVKLIVKQYESLFKELLN